MNNDQPPKSVATLESLVTFALDEDLADIGDVTSDALIDNNESAVVKVISRGSGIISGIEAFTTTLIRVDQSLKIEITKKDGDRVNPGDAIASVHGSLKSILKAERTALNFLQHLSGVATLTNKYVHAVQETGSKTIIRDTRKTLPGYRALEKAAVRDGGGQNHRRGLYDAFLVKDNHIAHRDLSIISKRCREFNPKLPLEIEVDSLDQLKIVLCFNPDIVLLDNFGVKDVYTSIELAGNIDLEISGGVNLDNISLYAKTGVKYIAVGAITHSAPALDIGFDI